MIGTSEIGFEQANQQVNNLLPKLTAKDILIVDEMSMVDLNMMNYLLAKVKEAGSKVIFVGDDNQFSPVGIGGAANKLVEQVENVTLNEIFRQKSKLDQQVTNQLANFRIDQAIKQLHQAGRFTISNTEELLRQNLINDYINQLKDPQLNNKNTIIIAYRNEQVNNLNEQVRVRLLNLGKLYTNNLAEKGQEFHTVNGNKIIAIGERLVFTKNNKRDGIINGDIAEVVRIIDKTKFEVKIAANKKASSLIIDTNKYSDFDYGYAITAYKSQGKTYDNSYILVDESVGYEAFNVMATRHRENSQFYVDKQLLSTVINRQFAIDGAYQSFIPNEATFDKQQAALFKLLTRGDRSALAHDYLSYKDKPQVKLIKSYLIAKDAAANIYQELLLWQESELQNNDKVKIWHHKELWLEFKIAQGERNSYAKELIADYKSYHQFINGSTINYATLLKQAGISSIKYDDQTKTVPKRLNKQL